MKQSVMLPRNRLSICLCVCVCELGPGSVEESKAQCLSGPDQERGREEDDGKTHEN